MVRERRKRKQFPVVPVLIAAAVLILLSVVLGMGLNGQEEEDVTQAGIAYLESLEKKDPNGVDQVLWERRQAELEAQREELIRQVKAGELDPFTQFQNSVILGDSRAVGFSYYGYVDESQNLSGTGDTILNLPGKIDTLEAMNPQYIYLCYGLNDIKIGHWASIEAHIASYMDKVEQIRQRLPDAVIVISSVLPYREEMRQPDPTSPTQAEPTQQDKELKRLVQIPAWNEAMAAACAESGVIFVDNSGICEEYENLWEGDGIHVKKPFYPHWGKNLIVAALEEGGTPIEEDPA